MRCHCQSDRRTVIEEVFVRGGCHLKEVVAGTLAPGGGGVKAFNAIFVDLIERRGWHGGFDGRPQQPYQRFRRTFPPPSLPPFEDDIHAGPSPGSLIAILNVHNDPNVATGGRLLFLKQDATSTAMLGLNAYLGEFSSTMLLYLHKCRMLKQYETITTDGL